MQSGGIDGKTYVMVRIGSHCRGHVLYRLVLSGLSDIPVIRQFISAVTASVTIIVFVIVTDNMQVRSGNSYIPVTNVTYNSFVSYISYTSNTKYICHVTYCARVDQCYTSDDGNTIDVK